MAPVERRSQKHRPAHCVTWSRLHSRCVALYRWITISWGATSLEDAQFGSPQPQVYLSLESVPLTVSPEEDRGRYRPDRTNDTFLDFKCHLWMRCTSTIIFFTRVSTAALHQLRRFVGDPLNRLRRVVGPYACSVWAEDGRQDLALSPSLRGWALCRPQKV